MGEEVEDSLNLLSLNDFLERGIDIDKSWNGLDALVAAASLASKKLEEERIRKDKQKKSGEEYCQFPALKHCQKEISPCTSKQRDWLSRVRVSDQKQKEKDLKKPVTNDLNSKKAQGLHNNASNHKLMGDAMKAGFRRNDGDWDYEYTNEKKVKMYPNKKQKRERPFVLDKIPDLPQEFKERIQQLNGSKIDLVIQKSLYPTDISDHHYRLSIPKIQIVSKDFLTDEERRNLDNEGEMQVYLIEPLLQECEMTFKRNKEKKERPRANRSFCYVLIKDWKKLKDRNNLKLNDTIQLWKFRLPNEQLGLAIVLVDRNGSKVCEDNSKKLEGDGAKTSQGTGEDGSNVSHDNNDQTPTSAATESTTTDSPMDVN